MTLRTRIAWLVLLLCCLPIIANLLGVDFSSHKIPLSPDKVVDGSYKADDLFYAVAGAMHHALLEWSAVSLAVVAAFVSFLHYTIRRDVTVPIIGVALLCAGFVDAFHTLAATRIIQANAPNTDFIPFTWALSRIFNALIMITGASISLWIMRRSLSNKALGKTQTHGWPLIILVSVVFITLAYAVVHMAAISTELPQTMYREALVKRPFDVLPLALFLLGGTLFSIWYQLKASVVKFALMLSIIPEVITQLHMAFGSIALFDNHFNIAHGLKIVAYGCVLLGILIDLVRHLSKVAPKGSAAGLKEKHKSLKGSLKVGIATRPLSVQLPVMAFVLAMLVAGVVGFSFYFESERLVLNQEVSELKNQSHLVEPLLAQLYRQSAADTLLLANTPPIQGIAHALNVNDKKDLKLWKDRLQQIFFQMLKAKPNYLQVRYIGLGQQGTELVNVLRNIGGIQVVPKTRLQNKGASNYYQETFVKNLGEISFSAIELNKEHGKVVVPHQPVVRVSTPIFNELTGDIFGIVIINIDIVSFIQRLHETDLVNLTFYLADESGNLLYDPDAHTEVDLSAQIKIQDDFPALQEVLDAGLAIRSFHKLKNTKHEIYPSFYRYISLEKYGSSHPLHLLLQNKTQKAKFQLESFRNRSLMLGVSMALLALGLAILAAKRLTHPLVDLTDAVQQYDIDGNISGLPTKNKDEVGVLARSFNNLLLRMDNALLSEKASASRTKGIVDNAADGIMSINDVGIIVSFNIAAEKMFLYEAKEVIGENIKIIMPKVYSDKHDAYLENYKRTGKKTIIGNGRDVIGLRKGGSEFDGHLAVSEIMTEDGAIYTGIVRDVSVQKQAEQAMLEAKEAAETAALSKSEFLASMSHEIRTPMNGVLGMLGLLKRSELTQEQVHNANLAISSAESLLTIINDILDFSKVEAGKLELESIDFNLRSQLGEFIEFIAPKAQEKGLEIILDVRQVEQSMVNGDPGRLRQVLNNLVGNAIKFTSSGEIIVRINLQEENNNLRLNGFVIDTGIGIESHQQKSLFESFTQVDASTTRKYGGTGLGLAISKKLCELMGGGISVSSNKDQGSCFEFNILLKPSQESTYVLPSVDIKGIEMLIVDDNETNLEVLNGQLSHWGAVVTMATSGEQALQFMHESRVKGQAFKVAFLDMQMPEMDGAMLGKSIRENTAFDDTRLVMMTSMSSRGDAQLFADLGFDAYFPKPTTTSDLFDALAVVLAGGDVLKNASPLVTQHYLRSLDRNDTQKNRAQWPKDARLLLVEDNHINQVVALSLLEDIGLHADVAGNGKEALQALEGAKDSKPYTLILMDCQMPEMDGYEATRQIRQGKVGKECKNITIVAMTANAMKGDKEKCLAAGMTDYLSKPINGEMLEDKLREYLTS